MNRLPLVSPLDRALFLKAQPYLEGLPSGVLAVLAEHTEETEFRPHEQVFEEGAPPEQLFFLSSGTVRIQDESRMHIDLHAPAGIGLMVHLAKLEKPPSVWALDPVQALAIDLDVFMQILEDDFVLYQTIARTLSRTVLDAHRALGERRPSAQGFPHEQLDATPARLDLVQRLAQARKAPFFEESSLTVLTELLRFQEPRYLAAGETLWRHGDPVSSMALILDGSFVCSGSAGESTHPPGSMLGGWEIFALEARAQTARTVSAARLVEIDRMHFTDVLEDHFDFARDYLGKLSREAISLRSLAPSLSGPPGVDPGRGHPSGTRTTRAS